MIGREFILKLTVEKGPAQGETLERNPGRATIRIGRFVRGNNFIIKDPEISSKHLFIQFKDINWVLYDLGTLNGTLLNGSKLQGNKGFDLKDGDLIEIGELTCIRVSIGEENTRGGIGVEEKKKDCVGDVEDEKEELGNGVGQLRRNPRRGATNKQQITTESSQVSVDKKSDNVALVAENSGRRGARKWATDSKNEPMESDKNSQVKPSQSTRVSAINDNLRNAMKLDLQKMKKMTLGEYLKFLEVYLPHKIREETNEVIADMKVRAEQFKIFMLAQQNLKNMSPLT